MYFVTVNTPKYFKKSQDTSAHREKVSIHQRNESKGNN